MTNLKEKEKEKGQIMASIHYYSEEKPYWDKQARRFEEGAKKVARYRMPCVALTVPYTPLTWLMANFIHSYYLSDMEGFEGKAGRFWKKKLDSNVFWKRTVHSGIYQYELRINSSPEKKIKRVLENVIEIYKSISKKGFNTAKPVPVTENIRGEIVPLKGAKRIAALLALGVEWVPVLEYDQTTLGQIPPEQKETACVDHSNLIFDKMSDLPEVQSLRLQYEYLARLSDSYGWMKGMASLRHLVGERGRSEFYNKLLGGSVPLTKYVSELDVVSPPMASVVIGPEVEIVLWLLKRAIRCFVIMTDKNIAEQVMGITAGTDETRLRFTDSRKEIAAIIESQGCEEIWCVPQVEKKMKLTDNQKRRVRLL